MKTRPLMTVTMMMMMMMVSSSQELKDDHTVQDLPPPSPRTSWLMFINNSDTRRRSTKHVLQGPPGAGGPPLPRPHPQRLTDDLLATLAGVSPHMLCERPARVSASFLGRLPRAVRVARRSLVELRPFSQPPEDAFQRGRGFNARRGRYTATLSEFYLLSARLRLNSGERAQVRLRDSVRAAICVESLCHTKLSIESLVGVAKVGGAFGFTLTGALFLQAGEYASVYVDNASGADVRVLPGSFFSAMLLGS